MKRQGKDLVTATALAATLVITLVLTSNLLASYLGGRDLLVKAYATETTIQYSGPFTKDFLDDIISAGGGFMYIFFCPNLKLFFENGTERTYYLNVDWINEGVVDASELKEIHVSEPTLGMSNEFSEEFKKFTIATNFSWYGNYNKGNEIQTNLQVHNETTDLGTSFQDNILFTFNLNSSTIERDKRHPLLSGVRGSNPIFGYSGFWQGYDTWRMESSQLLEMVDHSESASILFHGSVWVDGEYTVTVDGVPRHETINLFNNVSFGRIDLTFEDGKISTLSFQFNKIDIILFVYPEE